MFGHVNNAAFATYVETARLAFYRDVLGGTPERPGGVVGHLILAQLAMDFRQQLHFGASAHVTTVIERVGRTSMALKQQVVSAGQVVVDASSVVVAFDYDAQKPVEVPAEARRILGFA